MAEAARTHHTSPKGECLARKEPTQEHEKRVGIGLLGVLRPLALAVWRSPERASADEIQSFWGPRPGC